MKMPCAVGVDIGGGHIGCGLVTASGEILNFVESSIPDVTTLTLEVLTEKIGELIASVREGRERETIVAVGIGCPGQSRRGVLVAASNLPTLKKVPLADSVSRFLGGMPTTLMNDADAAMAAEMWSSCGASSGKYANVQHAAMLTLGTGIGSGIMLNGKMHEGANGLIEAGHMIVNPLMGRKCGCGQVGCAESHSSAFNTALRMNEVLVTQPGGNANLVKNAKDVYRRAAKGDMAAQSTLDATIEYLAILCVNICRVIDPEVIILAGGMARAGDALLLPLRKRVLDRSWKILPTDVQIELGGNVERAGVVGAALAALKNAEEAGSPGNAAGGDRLTKSRPIWRGVAAAAAVTLTAAATVLAVQALPREWRDGGLRLPTSDMIRSLDNQNKIFGAQLLLSTAGLLGIYGLNK